MMCSIKKVFLKNLQNSQENTSARVSFSIKFTCEFRKIFKNIFFTEHFWVTASDSGLQLFFEKVAVRTFFRLMWKIAVSLLLLTHFIPLFPTREQVTEDYIWIYSFHFQFFFLLVIITSFEHKRCGKSNPFIQFSDIIITFSSLIFYQ